MGEERAAWREAGFRVKESRRKRESDGVQSGFELIKEGGTGVYKKSVYCRKNEER